MHNFFMLVACKIVAYTLSDTQFGPRPPNHNPVFATGVVLSKTQTGNVTHGHLVTSLSVGTYS